MGSGYLPKHWLYNVYRINQEVTKQESKVLPKQCQNMPVQLADWFSVKACVIFC